MFHWVETHGFESMAIAWVISSVISVMPPLPTDRNGFWSRWAYLILKWVGASLTDFVKSSPEGNRLESLAQVKDVNTEKPDGSLITEHTQTSLEVNSKK